MLSLTIIHPQRVIIIILPRQLILQPGLIIRQSSMRTLRSWIWVRRIIDGLWCCWRNLLLQMWSYMVYCNQEKILIRASRIYQISCSTWEKMKRIYSFLLVFCILMVISLITACASAQSNKIRQTAVAQTGLAGTLSTNATFTPSKAEGKQQLISEVIPLLEIGTPDASAKAWNKLRLVGNYKGKYWNDEEIQTLLWFSHDMINVSNGHVYPDAFSLVSPAYAGIYHEQISVEVLKHISMAEWQRRYELNSPIMATVVAKARLQLP